MFFFFFWINECKRKKHKGNEGQTVKTKVYSTILHDSIKLKGSFLLFQNFFFSVWNSEFPFLFREEKIAVNTTSHDTHWDNLLLLFLWNFRVLPLFTNEADLVSLLLISTAESNACVHITSLGKACTSKLLVTGVITVNYSERSL